MPTFINARVFDGQHMLPGLRSVRVDRAQVAAIEESIAAEADDLIDVQGMTLMPGMISCHLHPDFYKFSLAAGMAGERPGNEFPPGVMMAIGVRTCRVLLESGFTGYVGAACAHDIDAQLKIAIAEGIVPGPRIRACSHHIGTTADLNDSPKWWRRFESAGVDLFVDGPENLRKTVREEIRRGAQTIKIFASSGHGFEGRAQRNMARDEIASVVGTAHALAARVRAHVSDRDMILECIELGVDVLDHADDIDEQCIEAMVKAGTFWVPSLIYPKCLLQLGWGDARMQARYDHVRRMLPLAQQAGVRMLVGDDYSGVFRGVLEDDPLDHQLGCYGREFAYYAAIDGLTAEQVLGWGTKNAGELLVDAPARAGVIEAGALADLIVVDGDPTRDPGLLSRPAESLKLLMRDGVVAIDRLSAEALSL
jgi:imidazolonepropionase-like amidohydrolase